MGLDKFEDNLSQFAITLKRCEEDLIIKACNVHEEEPEATYKFQLSSLFTLLEDGKLTNINPGLTNITSLDLSHCRLTELPKSIKMLRLKNFNISHNEFTQVPSCLYSNGLQTLENLDMSYNKLNNFDIEPDCVLTLKKLKINNNCFENVPKWLLTFRCTNLEEFNYSENRAEHYNFLKNSFNLNFMKLKKLELKNSCLLDEDIPWIKCFKTLNYLDISNKSLTEDRKYINKFRELDQLFIKPCWKNIEVLKLNFLDISLFPEGIFWVESLKEVHLTNNYLSWFSDGLEFLVNLELLNVANNELVCIPKQISKLPKLKAFFASGNNLEELPIMPNSLELLDLYDNHLSTINNVNLGQVKLLDLELNYSTFDDKLILSSYCDKKEKFRKFYNAENRVNGIKFRPEVNSSSEDSKSSDSECYEENFFCDNGVFNERIPTPDEDWDREDTKTPAFQHPDITLSDNEFDGDEHETSIQGFYKPTKIYIDDEDVMFIDAD